MRVLLIASYLESLYKFRGDLINEMLVNGVDVYVCVPGVHEVGDEIKSLKAKGVIFNNLHLKRTGINPIFDLFSVIEMIKLIYVIKPDYLLAYTIKPVIYGLIASSITNVPNRFALITGLGYAFTGDAFGARRIIRRIVRKLYKVALAKADVVFFQNSDDAALFRMLGITTSVAQTRIVNGSGINTSQYPVVDLPDKPAFLLIARLLGDKGVREYAKAAKLVKQKYPAVCFDLVGWIDENPDAIRKQELDEWIAAGIINFKGKLSDVRPAIAASSVYVLPSYREGTPRTVLEAMAMGRAIITTDAPGCRETVQEGVNGKLVEVKSIVELADAMIELIENPELIKQYGKNSRLIAEEKYDVHKVNSFMLKVMGLI